MTIDFTSWSGISLIFFYLMMIGFGCSLEIDKFRDHIKKPKGIILGFLLQYLIMPCTCFFLSKFLEPYGDHYAVALILIGCCPGGGMSNMISYILRMDIELSIAMTTCSSIGAIIMMPLNTYIYVRLLNNVSFVFDWTGLIVSCLTVVLGTLTGLLVNVKFYKYSLWLEKLAVLCMLVLIAGAFIGNGNSNTPIWEYNWIFYVVLWLPPIIGGMIGFLVSLMVKLPKKSSSVAVHNETGLQNGVLALAIILLTYKFSSILDCHCKTGCLFCLWSFFLCVYDKVQALSS